MKLGLRAVAPGLTLERRVAEKGFARRWILWATLFTGGAIVLQKPLTKGFPEEDLFMGAVTLVVVFSVVGTLIKAGFIVSRLARRVEQRVGLGREVRLRDIFNKGIRWTAFLGGALHVFYSLLFVLLLWYVSPAGMAATRACVIIPLAVIEIGAGIMVATGAHWQRRLFASIAATLAGALVVIFAGGNLFKTAGPAAIILLMTSLTLGNLALAIAEIIERHGVHHPKVSSPVYTLARFIAFSGTAIAVMVAWGFINKHFDVMLTVLHICLQRWPLLLGIAFFWALTDLTRICVKTIVSSTYMYVLMALAMMIDVIAQVLLHKWRPDIYNTVFTEWTDVAWALVGALMVLVGVLLHPPLTETWAELRAAAQ